jgi:hypothetical protein
LRLTQLTFFSFAGNMDAQVEIKDGNAVHHHYHAAITNNYNFHLSFGPEARPVEVVEAIKGAFGKSHTILQPLGRVFLFNTQER